MRKKAAREKAIQAAEKLRARKLAKATRKVEDGIEETLTLYGFSYAALDPDSDQ